MALPPELIRIKRRRDEEPVDSLFIHTENQQKRRRVTNFVFQRVTEEDGPGEVSPGSPKKQGLTAQPRRTVSSYARAEVPVVRATLPGEELLSGRKGVGISGKKEALAESNGATSSVLDTVEGEGGTEAALFQTGASSSTKPRDLSMFTRRFHLKKTTSTFPSRGPASGIQKRKKGQRPEIAVFVEKAREPKRHDSHLTAGHRGTDSQASLKVRSDGVPVVQLNLARPRKRPGTGARAAVRKKGAEHGGKQDLHRSLAASRETPDSMDAEPEVRDHGPSPLAEALHRSTLQPSALQRALNSATNLDVRQPASNPFIKPQGPAPTSQTPSSHLPERPSTTPQHRHRSATPPDPALPLAAFPLAASPPRPKSKVPPLDFNNPYPYGPETVPSRDAADADSDAENEDDYVYDTYIRQPTQAGINKSLRLASAESVDSRKVGIIVITHEDEKLWETYGVDEGKDEDWDSEDEDENGESQRRQCLTLTEWITVVCRSDDGADLWGYGAAEDYHANDYPDDELDSDDEFGRGAYRYRRNASDAEEFDEDAASWSDEEKHPWNRQRNPWALGGRGVEDSDEEDSD